MLFVRLIVALGVLLCFQNTFGQSISSVVGTISHDRSIVISGSSFGPKSSSAPVVWDNLEDGTCNTTAAIGTWTTVEDLTISSDNLRGVSSYNAHANMCGTCGNNNAYFTGGSNSAVWYVSYWLYLSSNWNWGTTDSGGGDGSLSNVKYIRFWDTGSNTANTVSAVHPYNSGTSTITITEQCDGSNPGYWSWGANAITLGAWHHLQFEFSHNSSPGAADGVYRQWFDGVLVKDESDLVTRCTGNTNYGRPFIVGFYNSWTDSGSDADDFYIDDVYIDNTWARIEIGNEATYSSCTHREIQVPSAWSDSSITIKLNRGSFGETETAYLFIIDSSGNASSGYQITFGDTYGSTQNVIGASLSGATLQ